MERYRQDPSEFIEFIRKNIDDIKSEAMIRRVMSGCYYVCKLLAWEYAFQKLGCKSLKEVASDFGFRKSEAMGFRAIVIHHIQKNIGLPVAMEFLHQSRVMADHYFSYEKTVDVNYSSRKVECNIEEAKEALKFCEELSEEIINNF